MHAHIFGGNPAFGLSLAVSATTPIRVAEDRRSTGRTRRVDTPSTAGVNRSVRFPNSRSYVGVARRTALEFARALGLPEEKLEDLGYAVGEALANAVEHGFRERTYFQVRVWRSDHEDAIVIEVQDDGEGFDPAQLSDPDENAARGYGITIMRAMADRVSFERNGRLVRLWKLINRSADCRDFVKVRGQ
jgi:anti-sigma regulatory factor (Ser/Thr protein kinase)